MFPLICLCTSFGVKHAWWLKCCVLILVKVTYVMIYTHDYDEVFPDDTSRYRKMLPYSGRDYIFQIVGAVFITTVTGAFDLMMQPVGPGLCKYHCAQISECTFCMFLVQRLACIAAWSKTPPHTKGEVAVFLDITKEIPSTFSLSKELCTERPSRMILSRSKDPRCIKLKPKEQTRVLVSPYMSRGSKTPLRSFHLEDNSITTYRHIRPRLVTAMAYVPTLRQVLVATLDPPTIQAFSLHTTVGVTVAREIVILSIAVDDAKQLVFLATQRPFGGVASMMPDGRNLRKISSRVQPRVLCLDTGRTIFYAADHESIFSASYSGHRWQWITRSHDTLGITLGDQGNVMYYNDKTTIVRLELFKKEKERKVIGLNMYSRNILYRHGYLCVSHLSESHMYVLHESNYSSVKQVNIRSHYRLFIAMMP